MKARSLRGPEGSHLPTFPNFEHLNSVDGTAKDKHGSMLTAFALFQIHKSGRLELATSFDSKERSISAIPRDLQNEIFECLKSAAHNSLHKRWSPKQRSIGPGSPPSDCGSLDLEDCFSLEGQESSYRGLKRASEVQDGHPRSKKARRFVENSAGVEPHHLSLDLDLSDDTIQNAPINTHRYQTIKIADEDQVTEALQNRLELLKQLGVKKILKPWIEKICPKKQSRFPYIQSSEQWRRDHQISGNERPPVPGWWPLDKCQHKEPDHSSKSDRMKLAMHIIRIRNREVKDWRSAGKSSWTNMLKDATGEVSLNYGDEDKPEDVETRNDILNDFYRLAQREEEYREGEIDSTAHCQVNVFDIKRRCGRRAGVKNRTKGAKKVRTKGVKRARRPTNSDVRRSTDGHEAPLEKPSRTDTQEPRNLFGSSRARGKEHLDDLTITNCAAKTPHPDSSVAHPNSNCVNETGSLLPPEVPIEPSLAQKMNEQQNIKTLYPDRQYDALATEPWKLPVDGVDFASTISNYCLDHASTLYPRSWYSFTPDIQTTSTTVAAGLNTPANLESSSIDGLACPYSDVTPAPDSVAGTSSSLLSCQPSKGLSYFSTYLDEQHMPSVGRDTLPLGYGSVHLQENIGTEAISSRTNPDTTVTYDELPMYGYE